MTRSAVIGMIVCACLLSSCGEGPPETEPRPADALPEYLEIRIEGPSKWDDRFGRIDNHEDFEIILERNPFDDREEIKMFCETSMDGSPNSNGGGTLREDKNEYIDVAHEGWFFFHTSGRIQFGITEVYRIKLIEGTFKPGELVRLKVMPGAVILPMVHPDSPLNEAHYSIETMDGFSMYGHYGARKAESAGMRMVEAGKQYRVVRLHHPEEVHIIGPFDAGTRNEVVLNPTVFGG